MASKPKKKNGRPTIYTRELGTKICEQIIAGKSVRTICKAKRMPDASQVFRWLAANNEEFREQYARAREIQAELIADETVEIADTPMIGEKRTTKVVSGKKRVETVTGDMVERSRLMVDARKWKAAKLLPKKYGDKLDIDLGKNPLDALLEEFREEHARIQSRKKA